MISVASILLCCHSDTACILLQVGLEFNQNVLKSEENPEIEIKYQISEPIFR